ncbi:nitroreductase/quinone reductase family protein [Amycolatopsis albispora]|uniref:Nitroreductase n=1 Tax=Amycolatopsis albispora TaxID=1804986 RepID=A0A344L0Y7_9PSEU|nr:nitroreductase/quinone reductase family protein [Amycolatopsis albispora]AXB41711.1 hypothetical protein A4R43_03575 [Amycolatopsis albispora]
MPVLCYRLRLGFLFGHRLVHLVHVGRRPGRRWEVVLEVVRSAPDEIVVVAGWDERSDWFRNLAAAPAVEVRSGATRWTAPRHPRAWKRLALGVPAAPATAGSRLRAIAFRPA